MLVLLASNETFSLLLCACRIGFNDKSLLESPADFLRLLTIHQSTLISAITTDDYPCHRIYTMLHITDFTLFWRCFCLYSDADYSLARPARKQATTTEDFEFHVSYL